MNISILNGNPSKFLGRLTLLKLKYKKEITFMHFQYFYNLYNRSTGNFS